MAWMETELLKETPFFFGVQDDDVVDVECVEEERESLSSLENEEWEFDRTRAGGVASSSS